MSSEYIIYRQLNKFQLFLISLVFNLKSYGRKGQNTFLNYLIDNTILNNKIMCMWFVQNIFCETCGHTKTYRNEFHNFREFKLSFALSFNNCYNYHIWK